MSGKKNKMNKIPLPLFYKSPGMKSTGLPVQENPAERTSAEEEQVQGNVEPKVVNSARKRALEVEKQKKIQAKAAAEKELDKMTLKEADETKSKEQLARELAEKENAPGMESSEVLQKYKVSQMQILDSYSPMYEFD